MANCLSMCFFHYSLHCIVLYHKFLCYFICWQFSRADWKAAENWSHQHCWSPRLLSVYFWSSESFSRQCRSARSSWTNMVDHCSFPQRARQQGNSSFFAACGYWHYWVYLFAINVALSHLTWCFHCCLTVLWRYINPNWIDLDESECPCVDWPHFSSLSDLLL